MHFKWTSDEIEIVFGSYHSKRKSASLREPVSDQSYPPTDVLVQNGTLHIWVDVPGICKEDINVYIQNDILIIDGIKRTYKPSAEKRNFLRMERLDTPFRRVIRIIRPASYDNITSKLSNGVLHIFWDLD